MTVVIGTAGHIDHGKTTLVRALTGIDADRLPEERRRGMTIDVGYAHIDLDDGRAIDFVDVPGHDRLVGNMLVGAGEIDAAMLVVAADDGPRAQTLEHLALLDALDVPDGLVVVTKIDAVDPARVAEVGAVIRDLIAPTSLRRASVLAASGVTGEGMRDLRAAVVALADRAIRPGGNASPMRPPTLAVDRAFSAKGHGVVVTGTLRGGPLERGDTLRVVPAGSGPSQVRIREIQVHGSTVARVETGGRTALNVAGVDLTSIHRGMVLTADPSVVATDRMLARFARGPADVIDRTRGRLHAGTAAVDATIGRSGRDALVLPDGRAAGIIRLAVPVALRPGHRVVLRRGPGRSPIGAVVLDTTPPRGISRRRQTVERVAALDQAITVEVADLDRVGHGSDSERAALVDLHGAIEQGSRTELAPDVRAQAEATALSIIADGVAEGVSDGMIRAAIGASIRRSVTIRRDAAMVAAAAVLDGLIDDERLIRDGERIRLAGAAVAPVDPERSRAQGRLVAALETRTPPGLAQAVRDAGCSPADVRELERDGRVVVVAPDLAYARTTYDDLAELALGMASAGPLSPAAFRDATGTSRKLALAILEDLDRSAILRRTADGHVPGPRAPRATPR
jgi:selenocysteine-specific elongation factor